MNTSILSLLESRHLGELGRKRATGATALILTADENASQRLPELIEQCGLEPVRIARVADLESCFLNSRASLLLCEGNLPDGTFRDALRLLGRLPKRIPVIVFSRIAEWEHYLEAVRLGAYDFLRYPFRTGELQWIVCQMLLRLRGAMGSEFSQETAR